MIEERRKWGGEQRKKAQQVSKALAPKPSSQQTPPKVVHKILSNLVRVKSGKEEK